VKKSVVDSTDFYLF